MSGSGGAGRPPGDPTRSAQPVTNAEEPPARPPREPPRDATPPRTFAAEGVVWQARLAGKGAWGTGSYGLGLVEAIHFALAASPTVPLREALVPSGRFEYLFDSELVDLLAGATPIEPPKPR